MTDTQPCDDAAAHAPHVWFKTTDSLNDQHRCPGVTPQPTWCVERYDTSWGGWRKMPTSPDDDSPATFATERAARSHYRALAAAWPNYRWRFRKNSA